MIEIGAVLSVREKRLQENRENDVDDVEQMKEFAGRRCTKPSKSLSLCHRMLAFHFNQCIEERNHYLEHQAEIQL